MSLVVRDDGERIGHAIIELASPHAGPLSVSLQFPDRTYVGADGRRSRGRHLFDAEAMDTSGTRFRLGPEVTAHVRESEIVTLADGAGASLGTVSWDGIRAPPERGGGVRVSGDARQASGARGTGAPVRRATAVAEARQSREPVAALDDPPTLAAKPDVVASVPARKRPWLPIGLSLLAAAGLVYIIAILAGLIGWHLEPETIAFEGPPGGPFKPTAASTLLTRTAGAGALSFLFGDSAPIAAAGMPGWLDLHATRAGPGWRFAFAVKPQETTGLPAARTEAQVSLAFPLRVHTQALVIALTIVPRPAPAQVPTPEITPAKPPTPAIDDALCDRLAGNRFDPDHPAGALAQDEIFKLTPEQSDAGLVACDAREDRVGADRRFLVQRGRLLAERALRRLSKGDVPGATADMVAAVAAWRRGDAVGSAYAANLLGAFHKGTFNRPAHAFATPDDGAALAHWREGMDRGSAAAQTNFAAELLSGQGVAADPHRALDLLRDALAKGEPRAAGVLGVALYTGSPRGVSQDKAKGWPLVVGSQCIDRTAKALVEQEIQRGAKPATDRHACPP